MHPVGERRLSRWFAAHAESLPMRVPFPTDRQPVSRAHFAHRSSVQPTTGMGIRMLALPMPKERESRAAGAERVWAAMRTPLPVVRQPSEYAEDGHSIRRRDDREHCLYRRNRPAPLEAPTTLETAHPPAAAPGREALRFHLCARVQSTSRSSSASRCSPSRRVRS